MTFAFSTRGNEAQTLGNGDGAVTTRLRHKVQVEIAPPGSRDRFLTTTHSEQFPYRHQNVVRLRTPSSRFRTIAQTLGALTGSSGCRRVWYGIRITGKNLQ